MQIKWRKEFNIDVELIDSQHQTLVDMINQLGTAKEEGRVTNVLKEILVSIVDYTNFHFAAEEAHMKEKHYLLLSIHKAQHKVLINEVIKILEEYKLGKTNISDDLLKVLQNWLIKHILDHDHQYGKFLKGNSTK